MLSPPLEALFATSAALAPLPAREDVLSWVVPSKLAGVAIMPAADPAPVALAFPGMAGPLVANPHPIAFHAGPLDTIYITGVVSGPGPAPGRPLAG